MINYDIYLHPFKILIVKILRVIFSLYSDNPLSKVNIEPLSLNC